MHIPGLPTNYDLSAIAPQLIIGFFGMLVLLLDAIWPRISKKFLAMVTLAGLVATGVVAYLNWPKGEAQPVMQGMVINDGFTSFFTIILCLGTALTVLLSVDFLERSAQDHGEYWTLLMFTTLGGMVMAASLNLICTFIGLEILSISLYILAGYQTERLESDESAMKYFLLGSFASAFFLYGVALVYGATNSVNTRQIAQFLTDSAGTGGNPGQNYLLLGGIAMLIVGFGFKVAVVPFHIWAPDVYEGAPTPVTAFMSVVAKVGGFAAFARVMASAFPDSNVQVQISAVLASIAALTMLVGNVVAVVQRNVKRMLAYSSIAHAGYMLVGLVAAVRPSGGFGLGSDAQSQALAAVLFYSLAYTVSNLGAFGVLLALRRRGDEIVEIDDFRGIGQRNPFLAALMALFLLSLAGLPPTAGFFGKLFLVQALVAMNPPLVWLLVLFALTSAVSFYYYLGVIQAMYMSPPADDPREQAVFTADGFMRVGIGLSAIGTLLFGFWAGGGLGLAQRVASTFFGPGGFSAMR